MLEAVFSNSAAGGLKIALGESRSEDIFCFSLQLSVGQIAGDCLSQQRQERLMHIYNMFPADRPYLLRDMETAGENLSRLTGRAERGEPVRIWYSGNPDEYCGMCWLITELGRRLPSFSEIRLVYLPDRTESQTVMQEHQGWGDVQPEELAEFLLFERKAGPVFTAKVKAEWAQAQEENAPLRAFVNGRIHSVPADFYDSFIRREIGRCAPSFHEAVLIGGVMGRYQLKIGDMWIAARIEEMIRRGELSPLTEPKQGELVYRRMLRKNNPS